MTAQPEVLAPTPVRTQSRRERWVLTRLQDLLEPDEISCQREDVGRHASDWSGQRLPGSPLAVLRPATIGSVQSILRVASAARLTVVPRGAGTGLSGAASAPDGSLVLTTQRLDHIISIDPEDEIAIVQPGVITAVLDAAAAEHGLMYAPDPASHELSTIGGNIATNAGGLHCVKYGVTRESVLALTVVLADGTVLRTGRSTIKGVVGYDLTSLIVGSEGTLGVVVEATVRLRPRPVATRTAAAFFPSVASAAAGLSAITRTRIAPSVLELLDSGTLSAIDRAQGTGLRDRGAALLLVQTDGYGADREIEVIGAAMGSAGGAVEFLDAAAAEHYLWLRRRGRGPVDHLWTVGEDVAVPRSQVADMLCAIEDIGRRHGLDVAVVAHAGDGNLHPMFCLPKQSTHAGIAPAALHAAADELVRAALARGGTISGEHGIGITKREWLEQEVGPFSLDLQRRLKYEFDPQGILNPHTWLARDDRSEAPLTRTRHPDSVGKRLTASALDAYGDHRS